MLRVPYTFEDLIMEENCNVNTSNGVTYYNAVITVPSHNEIEHKDIFRAMWSDILPNL